MTITRRFAAALAALSLGTLLTATPAAAHRPLRLTGTEYDQGGTSSPIQGRLRATDRLADQITSTTDKMLRNVARERARLPYGRISAPHTARHELTTYPAPADQQPSDQYSVTLRQQHRTSSPFTYQVAARKTDTNREDDTSWTSFSFAGAVTVAVTKLAGDATGCLVRPSSAHIPTRFADGTCTFTLRRASNVSVEFAPDTTNPMLHPMLLFANPPETDVPSPDDPNVLYFGPGVHYIGSGVQLHSNETVYVSGGAWVEGAFIGAGVRNVVFRGRGVIDGLFLDTGNQDANKNQPGLLDLADAHNVVVDGVTLVDGPRFNVRVLGSDVTVHNIKVISWWYSTDCIWAGSDSLVEGNFCKVNDDSLKPMTGPSVIRDNTVWQLENGAPFMISWNIKDDQSNFHVYDNDVIHAEHYWLSPQAIFRARHASPGRMSRYLFENIRVEDASWRLFYIILENNKWYDPTLGYGQISQLIFRNITATSPFTQPSVVAGIDAQHRVSDATFENVYMDGTCVHDAAGGNFAIDPATTDQIRIVRSVDHPCAQAPRHD
jgi:hypothetical protein